MAFLKARNKNEMTSSNLARETKVRDSHVRYPDSEYQKSRSLTTAPIYRTNYDHRVHGAYISVGD